MAGNPKSETRNRRSPKGNPKSKAFTLIELLVAIFIIGILVTLVIGVSNYIFEEASRKETQATQAVIMQAIEAFEEVMGVCPPDNDPNYTPTTCLLPYLTAHDAIYGGNTGLQSRIRKATSKILLKLPAGAMKAGGNQLYDGFGNPMRYEETAGLGGRPVLISDGPDNDLANTADDIRSDGS